MTHHIPIINEEAQQPKVLIIDAMCLLHTLKKGPEATKIKHLKQQFIEKIAAKEKKHNYAEVRFCLITINQELESKTKRRLKEYVKMKALACRATMKAWMFMMR